jgi:hypothetical protein
MGVLLKWLLDDINFGIDRGRPSGRNSWLISNVFFYGQNVKEFG